MLLDLVLTAFPVFLFPEVEDLLTVVGDLDFERFASTVWLRVLEVFVTAVRFVAVPVRVPASVVLFLLVDTEVRRSVYSGF